MDRYSPTSDTQELQDLRSKTVTFDEHDLSKQPKSDPNTRSRQWVRRGTTHTVESRVFHHAYIIKRPRALQFYHPEVSGSTTPLEKSLAKEPSRLSRESSNISNGSSEDSQKEERSTDNPLKQYQRVDLFIDLVWVGIIANLSGSFGEQAFGENTGITSGEATGEFILLFIPIWRMWDYLRDYIGCYYKDDLTDRNFIIWILLLCVLYGINAPFAFTPADEGNSLKLLIAIYLIARLSFLLAHLLQAAFMPFLRRQFLFQLVSTVVIGGLWVAAIYVPYPGKFALLILANGLEQPISFYLASPLGDRLLTGGWKRSVNVDRYVERHEGFFIIILGEGVFRLIEGSPSGLGMNTHTGTVLTALLMYYILHWIYFNGDQSKSFVHAVRRTWWKPFLWKLYVPKPAISSP
jgi:low temperature requirement protein LtrA